MARKKAKKPYHHGDLRDALIAAGVELIAERGAQGLGLREVARRVGVSHAAPYRHFADKDALAFAICEEGFRELNTISIGAAEAVAGSDAPARLIALGQAYVRFAVARPAHFQVMFGPKPGEPPETLETVGRETFDLLVSTMAEIMGRDDLEDPVVLTGALTAWSLVHGLANLVIDNHVPVDELGGLDAIVDAVLAQASRGLITPP